MDSMGLILLVTIGVKEGNFFWNVRGAPMYFAVLDQRKLRHKCVMTISFGFHSRVE